MVHRGGYALHFAIKGLYGSCVDNIGGRESIWMFTNLQWVFDVCRAYKGGGLRTQSLH